MTYRRHPMNKRINAPRPRRRQASFTVALRAASRALGAHANAISTALAAAAGTAAEAVARSLRSFNPTRPEYTLASGKADR